MPRITLVRGARQLLTLRGPRGPRRGADLRNLGLIQDGAVLIVDGLVKEVGSSRRVENLALARRADEIDATGRVVMPGFVDCDMYLVSGTRIPDLTAPGKTSEELNEAVFAADLRALGRGIQELSPRALEAQAQHVIKEAVRHGTTTLEAKSGFGWSEAGEIKILRVHQALDRQPVPLISTFVCTPASIYYQQRPEQYLQWICSHELPLIKRRKLAEFAEIRCEQGGFGIEEARNYLSTAAGLGLDLKIHAGMRALAGMTGLAVELEIASMGNLIDFIPEDVALLARSSTIVMLAPGAAFYLGRDRYAPARMLIDNGVAVALATNYNPETSPSQNMQMIMTLACTRMDMTPAEAIMAATYNAAYALRRSARIGSLEKDKAADLIILGVPDYQEIPYHFGINLVDLVMTNGQVVMERAEVKWPAN